MRYAEFKKEDYLAESYHDNQTEFYRSDRHRNQEKRYAQFFGKKSYQETGIKPFINSTLKGPVS